ncbi:MAG: hypothetical protein AB1568_01180 [Thermodesulfobacteriota bacterium]
MNEVLFITQYIHLAIPMPATIPDTAWPISWHMAEDTAERSADSRTLAEPLLLNAGQRHPSLTLADYFTDATATIRRHRESIAAYLGRGHSGSRPPGPIRSARLVSVKMGAFYHVARLDLQTTAGTVALAINTACSETGRSCLRADARLLSMLAPANEGLPDCVFHKEGEDCTAAGVFSHLAVQWFDDFHEWHTTATANGPACCLWDSRRGNQVLAAGQQGEILHGCARLLVRSFCRQTGAMIQRWHHAAGDFVVRAPAAGPVDVRLITVRDYAPLPFLGADTPPLVHLLFFFLDLCCRLRLDKVDGVGESCWLPAVFLDGAIAGFFAELDGAGPESRTLAADLRQLLERFSPGELTAAMAPLLNSYSDWLPAADLHTIGSRVEKHIDELLAGIREVLRT